MNLVMFLQNGLYIPIVSAFTYLFTRRCFISVVVSLRMYTSNYFFWFNGNYHYKNLPKSLNWVKQFIRFTDTGHIVSFLYFYNPAFLTIGYNVNFTITFGYWIGQLCFQLKDCDSVEHPSLMKHLERLVCACNHSLPLLFFMYEIKDNANYAVFDMLSLYYSCIWCYIWLFAIYIPWIYVTHDYVYSIMYPHNPWQIKLGFVGLIHLLLLISNYSGAYIKKHLLY